MLKNPFSVDTRVWQRYRPDRPVVTVTELYSSMDELAHRLHRGKPRQDDLKEQSAAAPRTLHEIVQESTRAHSPLALGDQALQVLELGMITGLVDALLMEDGPPWEEDVPAFIQGPLEYSWRTLWNNLNDARRVAHDSWKQMERDDLHLLWEYGRHQNLGTLEQAVEYRGKDDEQFQIFLLATYKAGYAIGIAQGIWQFCYPG